MTENEPRIKRVECGICETAFTDATVVEFEYVGRKRPDAQTKLTEVKP